MNIEKIIAEHQKWLADRTTGKCANLRGANLSDADLSNANLTGANLPDANLYRADLHGASLTGANLSDANLYRADLRGACLHGVNLSGANLHYANLTGANLTGADLTDADLIDANLTGVNLSDANLHYADLSGTNLTGANLIGAHLTYADLSGANLSDATMPTHHFQAKPGKIYWKGIGGNLRNRGYQYKLGLNIVDGEFADDPRELCSYPGFHIASKKWVSQNWSHNPYLCKVRIPKDAKINNPWANDGKASVDRLEILAVYNMKTGEDVTARFEDGAK